MGHWQHAECQLLGFDILHNGCYHGFDTIQTGCHFGFDALQTVMWALIPSRIVIGALTLYRMAVTGVLLSSRLPVIVALTPITGMTVTTTLTSCWMSIHQDSNNLQNDSRFCNILWNDCHPGFLTPNKTAYKNWLPLRQNHPVLYQGNKTPCIIARIRALCCIPTGISFLWWEHDHQKWLASWKIWSVEELETLPVDTKPGILHYWLNERGRHKWRKRSMIFLARTKGACSITATVELFQWQYWGSSLEMGRSAYGFSWTRSCHHELSYKSLPRYLWYRMAECNHGLDTLHSGC